MSTAYFVEDISGKLLSHSLDGAMLFTDSVKAHKYIRKHKGYSLVEMDFEKSKPAAMVQWDTIEVDGKPLPQDAMYFRTYRDKGLLGRSPESTTAPEPISMDGADPVEPPPQPTATTPMDVDEDFETDQLRSEAKGLGINVGNLRNRDKLRKKIAEAKRGNW